jgi:peptidoglycan/LPS O-acetylase OafA/YrhL
VLARTAWWVVAAFWAISGYVLAPAYDGRYVAFIVRRVVRLCPVFAVCTCLGGLIAQRWPSPGELLWWPPTLAHGSEGLLDPPSWSLYVEIFATPLLPAMFWAARHPARLAVAGALAVAAVVVWPFVGAPSACFVAGVAATRLPISWPRRVPRPLLALGDVSYSLYLSHFLVIVLFANALGRAGPTLSLLAIPGAAWLVWRMVERPSILLSRAAGARLGG